MLGRAVATLPALLLVAGLAAGCAGTQDDASGACLSAFRDATPRADAPYQVSPLDDAIKRCQTLAAWRDAWERVPEAHPPGQGALEYLDERCRVETLRLTQLCLDVANQAPASEG